MYLSVLALSSGHPSGPVARSPLGDQQAALGDPDVIRSPFPCRALPRCCCLYGNGRRSGALFCTRSVLDREVEDGRRRPPPRLSNAILCAQRPGPGGSVLA